MLNAAEIAVLRQLASEYAQAASLGGQGERRHGFAVTCAANGRSF